MSKRSIYASNQAPRWDLIPKMSPLPESSTMMRNYMVVLCLAAAFVFTVFGLYTIATWLVIAAAVITVSYLVYGEVRTNRNDD